MPSMSFVNGDTWLPDIANAKWANLFQRARIYPATYNQERRTLLTLGYTFADWSEDYPLVSLETIRGFYSGEEWGTYFEMTGDVLPRHGVLEQDQVTYRRFFSYGIHAGTDAPPDDDFYHWYAANFERGDLFGAWAVYAVNTMFQIHTAYNDALNMGLLNRGRPPRGH